MGEDQGEIRREEMTLHGDTLAVAELAPLKLGKGDFFSMCLGLCTTFSRTGCVLAWAIVNSKDKLQELMNERLISCLFNSGAGPRAVRKRSALPVREGGVGDLVNELRRRELIDVVTPDFLSRFEMTAWSYNSCFVCNSLVGPHRPLEAGSWSRLEKRMVDAVGESSKKLVRHGLELMSSPLSLEKEFHQRRVNYVGEEVTTCEKLSLAQILPALPPKEHGGSIKVVDFVSKGTRRLLEHPVECLVADVGQKLPKLQGRVHVADGEGILIANELVSRGVCTWIELERVVEFRKQKVLNGLFGVKSSTIGDGRPVLRVIMNLVPSNSILTQFKGAVRNLPMITTWMSTVLDENEELRVWQSDMSNAFYLFKDSRSVVAFSCIQHSDGWFKNWQIKWGFLRTFLPGFADGLDFLRSHHAGSKRKNTS